MSDVAFRLIDAFTKLSEEFEVTFSGPAITNDGGVEVRSLAASMQGTEGLLREIARVSGTGPVELYVSGMEVVGDSFIIKYRIDASASKTNPASPHKRTAGTFGDATASYASKKDEESDPTS